MSEHISRTTTVAHAPAIMICGLVAAVAAFVAGWGITQRFGTYLTYEHWEIGGLSLLLTVIFIMPCLVAMLLLAKPCSRQASRRAVPLALGVGYSLCAAILLFGLRFPMNPYVAYSNFDWTSGSVTGPGTLESIAVGFDFGRIFHRDQEGLWGKTRQYQTTVNGPVDPCFFYMADECRELRCLESTQRWFAGIWYTHSWTIRSTSVPGELVNASCQPVRDG